MIDHLSTYTTDFPAAQRLYDAVTKVLGFARVVDMVATWDQEFPTRRFAAYGPPGKAVLWLIEVKAKDKATPRHLAFAASTREMVDAFYRAALAAGGADNGPPGPRPVYHEHYYGAFVFDTDGNNIEAVCHAP